MKTCIQRLLNIVDQVDDGGVAPGQARRRAGVKVVHGGGAHKGQLHVRVRVNAAGHDVLAAGIDDLQAVEGVGESRARTVREGLSRLAESSILERYV